MKRVGLLFACMFLLVACFEERRVSLGSPPAAGSGAAGGTAGNSSEQEVEMENDDVDDPESGSTPGEDVESP